MGRERMEYRSVVLNADFNSDDIDMEAVRVGKRGGLGTKRRSGKLQNIVDTS